MIGTTPEEQRAAWLTHVEGVPRFLAGLWGGRACVIDSNKHRPG